MQTPGARTARRAHAQAFVVAGHGGKPAGNAGQPAQRLPADCKPVRGCSDLFFTAQQRQQSHGHPHSRHQRRVQRAVREQVAQHEQSDRDPRQHIVDHFPAVYAVERGYELFGEADPERALQARNSPRIQQHPLIGVVTGHGIALVPMLNMHALALKKRAEAKGGFISQWDDALAQACLHPWPAQIGIPVAEEPGQSAAGAGKAPQRIPYRPVCQQRLPRA